MALPRHGYGRLQSNAVQTTRIIRYNLLKKRRKKAVIVASGHRTYTLLAPASADAYRPRPLSLLGEASQDFYRFAMRLYYRYEFFWLSLALLTISAFGSFVFAWHDYLYVSTEEGHAVQFAGFVTQLMRATVDSWKSDYLRMLSEIAGLILVLRSRSNTRLWPWRSHAETAVPRP